MLKESPQALIRYKILTEHTPLQEIPSNKRHLQLRHRAANSVGLRHKL